MRGFTFLCLLALVAVLPQSQAAPAPKNVKAVIDAGTEKNIAWVLESVMAYAPAAIRANEKVANLDIVRRQKDLEAWLKKNLRVERIKGKNLIHVSFRGGNLREQVAIINAVVDYYLNNDLRERRNF